MKKSVARSENVVVTSAIKNVVQIVTMHVTLYVERNIHVEYTNVMKCVIRDSVLHVGEQVQ